MIRLAKPEIPEQAIIAVSEILRSGNLVQGKYVERLENKLASYLRVNNVVMVSSGTAALHLSLVALGINEGDEVIVPAFTFPATANAVELVGAKPVFVDINLNDFCIDTSKIEEAITPNTVAIMPVHEFGQAARMDDIVDICQKHKLKLIEDAACALGAEFNEQKVGTFGEVGCFSFHPRKAITTGEGGAISTNDEVLAMKLKVLRNHGMDYINGKIEFKYASFNYRMTDFQAALGLFQLDDFDKRIAYRQQMAQLYDKQLSELEWIITPMVYKNRKMTYQTYHILVSNNIDRDNLIMYLLDNGVQTNYGAQAVNVQPYYFSKYGVGKDEMVNVYQAFMQGVALPMGEHIGKKDIAKIFSLLEKFI